MPESDEREVSENPSVPLTSEPIGFAADALVKCPKCEKLNGPDRNNCIYCGVDLPKTELSGDVTFQPFQIPEEWESAVNLIYSGSEVLPFDSISSASRMLGLSDHVVAAIIETRQALPIARVAADHAAETVDQLNKLGLNIWPIGDEILNVKNPPVRVRSADLKETRIVLEDFNTAKKYSLPLDDLVLLVVGRIYESRREEVIKRKRGETKVLDEFETSGDVSIVDIYSSVDAAGFRVHSSGFDFSLLGDEMEMFADKNLRKLIELLKRHSSHLIVADEYDSVRAKLDLVWRPEVRKDLQGLQIRGYGKREFGAIFTTNNLVQFTKYSRMRRLMI